MLRHRGSRHQPKRPRGEEPQQPPPGYVPGDEALTEAERARRRGGAQVQQYFGGNQGASGWIIDWHQTMDPESKVPRWVIENRAQSLRKYGKLADNPEALRQIAEMTPRQRDRWLRCARRKYHCGQNFARQGITGNDAVGPAAPSDESPTDNSGTARRSQPSERYSPTRQQRRGRKRLCENAAATGEAERLNGNHDDHCPNQRRYWLSDGNG